MRVSSAKVWSYLVYVATTDVVGDEDLSDFSVFDAAIDAMAIDARKDGALDELNLVFDYLISHPAELKALVRHGMSFTTEEWGEIAAYAYRRIWPGDAISAAEDVIPIDFAP